MPDRPCHRRMLAAAVLLGVPLLAAGCQSNVQVGPDAIAGKRPDATVSMDEVQAAYIGSGSTGSGMLHYRGRSYPFSITGAGIGGIGVSTLDARGEVYNLRDIAQFAGAYGQARYGFALGSTSGGDLWLENETGVIMHLRARREGLMLSLGGDAMVISMR